MLNCKLPSPVYFSVSGNAPYGRPAVWLEGPWMRHMFQWWLFGRDLFVCFFIPPPLGLTLGNVHNHPLNACSFFHSKSPNPQQYHCPSCCTTRQHRQWTTPSKKEQTPPSRTSWRGANYCSAMDRRIPRTEGQESKTRPLVQKHIASIAKSEFYDAGSWLEGKEVGGYTFCLAMPLTPMFLSTSKSSCGSKITSVRKGSALILPSPANRPWNK